MIPEENPAIEAELKGELKLPSGRFYSGRFYEVGLGSRVDPSDRAPGEGSKLPAGPWRIIHLRLKGRDVWLRGHSSAFLFVVGTSDRPDAGADLFPALTAEHARRILEIAGMPTGRIED